MYHRSSLLSSQRGNSFRASFKVIPLSVYFVKTLVITYKLSGPDKYEEIISENMLNPLLFLFFLLHQLSFLMPLILECLVTRGRLH